MDARSWLPTFLSFFLISCSGENGNDAGNEIEKKEYCYEINEIQYLFEVPDTVYFGQQVVITGQVNKPVVMRFVIDSLQIGEIDQRGKFIWIPTKETMTEGEKSFTIQVIYCNRDGHSAAIASVKEIMLKGKRNSD